MRITGKFGIFFKIIFIMLIFTSTGLMLTAGDAISQQGLDVIKLNNKGYEKDRKGPVIFAHRSHAKEYEISCWKCHHDYMDDDNIWSPWDSTEKCDGCHDPLEEQDDIKKLQTAYHINCKTCHEKRAIFGDEPLAYRKCVTCHDEKGQ